MQRYCSQPPTALFTARRRAPRQLRQPATAFCETSAPHSHPEIHGFFFAPATLSQRPVRRRKRTQPMSRAGPRNPSPQRCRPRFPAPATQNDARVQMHDAPHQPRETNAEKAEDARCLTPATRIHRPAPSQMRTRIRSPTLATRRARPPSS